MLCVCFTPPVGFVLLLTLCPSIVTILPRLLYG